MGDVPKILWRSGFQSGGKQRAQCIADPPLRAFYYRDKNTCEFSEGTIVLWSFALTLASGSGRLASNCRFNRARDFRVNGEREKTCWEV